MTKLEASIKELKRELTTRKRVYPDWIRFGKIDQKVADERTEILQWTIDHLESQIPKQAQLF